jgi:predicted SAM-dependent methyltransferase
VAHSDRLSAPQPQVAATRLNWGCGPCPTEGWINCDAKDGPGIDLCCDIRDGLPLDDGSVDCIAAIHVLQDLPYADIAAALRELRRVLRPGGVLRLGLPDLDKAIDAYWHNDRCYFYVPDSDARSVAAKLVTQITWYGSVRTPMNYDFVREWLLNAGFRDVRACPFGVTRSRFLELASLDNRPRESLFVEAIK